MAALEATRHARRRPWSGDGTQHAVAPASIVVFAGMAFLVATLGGSSRYDLLQMPVLLPVACLAAGFGLIRSWDAGWSALRIPLILLMAWVALTILQVVPLPPELWRALPGREPMARIAEIIGDDRWRPLSMVPWRTQHALWTLGVPLAALFLFAALRNRAVELALRAIIAIAVINALLGILQITLPGDMLHYYAVTNRGAPVGLFANANHAAMLSAVGMIVIAATARLIPRPLASWQMPLLGGSFFIFLVTQFINGSRAGLGLTILALIASAIIAVQGSGTAGTTNGRGSMAARLASREIAIAVALLVGSLALAALFLFSARLPAVQEMMRTNALEDMRVQIVPVLQQMAWVHFPFGSGFGSFEDVFYIYEPSQMLGTTYVNQAHNDLLQVVIEGGVAALVIVLAALAWIGITSWKLLRAGSWHQRVLAIASTAVVAVLILSSGVDYPLRAPLFQFVAVLLVCVFASLAHREPRESTAR